MNEKPKDYRKSYNKHFALRQIVQQLTKMPELYTRRLFFEAPTTKKPHCFQQGFGNQTEHKAPEGSSLGEL
jgi:hypothetical protein